MVASTSNGPIVEGVTAAFRDVFDDPGFTPAAGLSRQDEPRWDSMNHLNLFFALEARFDIRFGVAEMEEVQCVGDLIRLVQEKTSTT